MTTIFSLPHFLSWTVFIYLAANTVYFLTIALCGRLIKRKEFPLQSHKRRIVLLIPCFREDKVIVDTARQAKAHNYPSLFFDVVVIADKLQPESIAELRKIPVEVMEVNLNMKSRSLHAALKSSLVTNAEIVVILDADNIMAPGCLERINAAFQGGVQAVQCHRIAKNRNSKIAQLDAISEEININLLRRGPALAGISATPNGSGMAFDTPLIKSIFDIPQILFNPGEDREIDIQLMKRSIKMEFLEDAYVYDEKVSSAEVFEKQRVRWLESQVSHVKRFFDADMKTAPRTFLYYNKFFQNLLLPRVLTLILFCLLLGILVIQFAFHWPLLEPAPRIWITMMGLYCITLLISIPGSFYNWQTVIALSRVPQLMLSMLRAMLQMKKKRTEFLHTPKSFTGERN